MAETKTSPDITTENENAFIAKNKLANSIESQKKEVAKTTTETKDGKRVLSMHAIKCKCGNILNRKMEHCPECGKNIETLMEELRQDFYRINFTRKQK